MSILYDIVCLVAALCYVPGYLFKKKFHAGFLARLGFLPPQLTLDKPIWVHAVSVGEAAMVRPFIEGLRKAYPGKKLVISTVTATGNSIVRSFAQDGDLVTYLPLDFSFVVRAVIDKIDPCLFVIAETELWPNLIMALHARKVPCAVVNARISDKSFRGYRMIKGLLKPVLKKVSLFAAQSRRDQERLIALGVPERNVVVTGNMKFDLTHARESNKDYGVYRAGLGLGGKAQLLVAASTHAGEEEIMLGAYRQLQERFGDLRLLLAPRHPERARQISALVARQGFPALLLSGLSGAGQELPRRAVFILDSVGQLLNYYAIADIVFVGGSLVAHGGHNILEPALFSKPVLFGPHMFNFRDIADLFLSNDAARMVRDQGQFVAQVTALLADSSRVHGLGAHAQELIRENQGATMRNLGLIQSLLADGV